MKKKKVIAVLLCFLMLLPNGTVVFANETSASDNEVITADDTLEIVDDNIQVDDGQFKVELSEKEIQEIGFENYKAITEGIRAVNALISEGTLNVTENGTLYKANDDELVIQGGNVNKVTFHWWGCRRYANNKETKRLVDRFNTCSNGAWIVCGSGATSCYVFPASAPIAGVVSGLSGMSAGYWGLLASRISAHNNGQGVIINLTWVLVFTVRSQ